MKKILLLFTFLIPAIFIPTSYGQKLSNLVAKKEKAIFQIFVYDEYGSQLSQGTGFYINRQGKALTNVHVIKDAKFAFIKDYTGNLYQIKKINRVCEACDIAEIIIDNKGQTNAFLTTTKSIPPKASEIFVIGNPEGFESTVSAGIISSIREEENKKIQISAPISPGSSGSPIMDMKGRVIGIATEQFEGQNLNFGYWIGCMTKLSENHNYRISNNDSQDFYVLNEICKTDHNLILNSIELNTENTVINLSFTNMVLAYGNDMGIWSGVGNRAESFYILDNITGEKFYAYDSNIGYSAENSTPMELFETKTVKLYFPKIKQAHSITIKNGTLDSSGWNFFNILLDKYKDLPFEKKNLFNDIAINYYWQLLDSDEFVAAIEFIEEYIRSNNVPAYFHTLVGVTLFKRGNQFDSVDPLYSALMFNAAKHMGKAIIIDPNNDNLHFNLYYLNKTTGYTNEALKNLNTAIAINGEQPEYYMCRAEIYFDKESWKNAEHDFTKVISSGRLATYLIYLKRAIARHHLKDYKGACNDYRIAYDNCIDEEKEIIEGWVNEYCR